MPFNYITLTPKITAYINLAGIEMNRTSDVFILPVSGNVVYSSPLTVINNFTTNARVSSIFPVVSAYNYPHFQAVDRNHLVVSLYGLSGTGVVDVLVYNQAGYTNLSNTKFLINVQC